MAPAMPVSCTTSHRGSEVRYGAMCVRVRPQSTPTTSPSRRIDCSSSAIALATASTWSAGSVGIGRHGVGVLEAVLALQFGGQLDVDGARVVDLDLDHPGFDGLVEHPGHLEPGQAELLGDLDPGAPLQVVAAGDHRALEQLIGPHESPPLPAEPVGSPCRCTYVQQR